MVRRGTQMNGGGYLDPWIIPDLDGTWWPCGNHILQGGMPQGVLF